MALNAKVWMLFVFLFMVSMSNFSQVSDQFQTNQLWKDYQNSENDSLRIEKLSELAFFHFDYLGDGHLADSLSELAIQIAESSHRPEMLFLACTRYVESNDLHANYQKALKYAQKAEQISATLNSTEASFRATKNLTNVYLSGYQYDKALESGYKSLAVATTAENAVQKAESYLNIGRSLEGKNQMVEAFRNYINASSIAEKTNIRALLISTYACLSDFYNFNKLYGKAARYKLMQRDLLAKQQPVDSIAVMWIEYDLQVIDINSNDNRLTEHNVMKVIDFARRKGHKRMMEYQIALYRTHLIEANRIGELKNFYQKQIPYDWSLLASEKPALYYRLKAFFSEEEKQMDSAHYYFDKAEELMQDDANMILSSKFYNRFGQFLMRHGHEKEALVKFSKSFELAEKASYFEYMMVASENLEAIYAGSNDYKNAYHYASVNKVLADSIRNLSRKEQIVVLEIDHETRQRERLAVQEREETNRRHNLQYMAMIIGIFSVFIILIMLGSLKVPEWIIRMLGFFSFIFLFEFIILLADHKIHALTHGEPWKIMLIKIFLIAILLPLHHSIEKRVIGYLLSHQLLRRSHFSVFTKLREKMRKSKVE